MAFEKQYDSSHPLEENGGKDHSKNKNNKKIKSTNPASSQSKNYLK